MPVSVGRSSFYDFFSTASVHDRLSSLMTEQSKPVVGQTYPTALLAVDLSGHSKISEKNPDAEMRSVKQHFEKLATEIVKACNGDPLGQWEGDGGRFWFRCPDAAKHAVEAAASIVAQEIAINLHEDLTDRLGIKASIHYGHITWNDKPGSISSTDLNFLVHLEKGKHLYPGAIVITRECYKELPKRIKAFFTKLGLYEATELYIWRPENTQPTPGTTPESPPRGPGTGQPTVERPQATLQEKAPDPRFKSALDLLTQDLPIKRQEGRRLVEGLLQEGAALGTEIARALYDVVMDDRSPDEERGMSLNLLTRARFWMPYKQLLRLWLDQKRKTGKRLSGQLTAFFAQPSNPGLEYMIALLAGLTGTLAQLESHRLWDMLNVFRCSLSWTPLPDTAYVETMHMIAKSCTGHTDESVRKIAEEIVAKIEGKA
jgi:class 3 adenylate cyclase